MFLIVLICLVATGCLGIALPSMLSPGGVLQTWNAYHTAAKLYGTAAPYECLSVEANVTNAPIENACADANGRWAISYNWAFSQTNLGNMTLSFAGNATANVTLTGVHWGDVFVCIGDGSMLRSLARTRGGDAWLAANAPLLANMRLFAAVAAGAPTPQFNFASEGACTDGAPTSDMPCNTWVDAATYAPSFSGACLQAFASLSNASIGGAPGNRVAGLIQLAVNASSIDPFIPPSFSSACAPLPAYNASTAGTLSNGMISPVVYFPWRAALLSMGPGDLGADPDAYACHLQALATSLRQQQTIGDFPIVLLSQPAAEGLQTEDPDAVFALRWAQASVAPSGAHHIDTSFVVPAHDVDVDGSTSLAWPDVLAERTALGLDYVAFWHYNTSYTGPTPSAAVVTSASITNVTVNVTLVYTTPGGVTSNGTFELHPAPGCTTCCTGVGDFQVAFKQSTSNDSVWVNASATSSGSALMLSATAPDATWAATAVRHGAQYVPQCLLTDAVSGRVSLPFLMQLGSAAAAVSHHGPNDIRRGFNEFDATIDAEFRRPLVSLHVDGSFDRLEYMHAGRARAARVDALLASSGRTQLPILAATPPMGFNSWQAVRCNLDAQLIVDIASSMASRGLLSQGYNIAALDDCWARTRLPNGSIIPDEIRFPGDMASVTSALRSLGFGFGIYTSATEYTCVGRPASWEMEAVDVARYCEWGVAYVKVDHCGGHSYPAYNTSWLALRAAINSCAAGGGRNMTLSVESCGSPTGCGAWILRSGAQLWRTTSDLQLYWTSIMSNMDGNEPMAPLAGPGHINDPDMLAIGTAVGLSLDEARAHFSAWAIAAAPLLISTDVRALSSPLLDILSAPEVIAVDQDPAVVQGVRVSPANGTGVECWARPLTPSAWGQPSTSNVTAVMMINRGDSVADITCTWAQLGLPAGAVATVRDLWLRAALPNATDAVIATNVNSHAVVMLALTTAA